MAPLAGAGHDRRCCGEIRFHLVTVLQWPLWPELVMTLSAMVLLDYESELQWPLWPELVMTTITSWIF